MPEGENDPMMLMWVSEVFWDPETDRVGQSVAKPEPALRAVDAGEDTLTPVSPTIELAQPVESW